MLGNNGIVEHLPQIEELKSFSGRQVRVFLLLEVIPRLNAKNLGPEERPTAECERDETIEDDDEVQEPNPDGRDCCHGLKIVLYIV